MPYDPDDNGDSPAVYQEQLSQPIVYNPEDYYLAVVRFSIPGEEIPIFIADIQPYPNTNVNNTIYSVTLEYNGTFSPQTFVQFITTTPNASPGLPLSPTHPNASRTFYYYVYFYTDFINMINNALATAFAALPTKPAGSPVAPYLIYDSNTERISLIVQDAFYDQALSLPITIYLNSALYKYLDAIPIIYLSNNSPIGQDVYFNVQNNHNNWYFDPALGPPTGVPTLLQMEQEYPLLSAWNDLKTIQIISNLLPINREFITSANIRHTGNGTVNSAGILSDFVPLINLGPEARNTIEFVATGPWRLITMYGSSPVTRVDVSIYWTDQFGGEHLLHIPPGGLVTMKLMFIKKEAVSYSGK
jgi:hypothetical protein